MQIINHLADWKSLRSAIQPQLSIGFVPTMGALHKGHGSLIQTSQATHDLTVVSIFVNPTQFNQASDFENYPTPLSEDLDYLEKLGVDYCLLPNAQEIYNDQFRYQIEEKKESLSMEGLFRPGHFTGVLTVVMKLLNLIKPTSCFFGEKDFQQYQLIHDMVNAFFMDVKIVACPTIREQSNLPFSSRNRRLSAEQRQVAEKFAHIFHQKGSINEIENLLKSLDLEVEYIVEKEQRRFIAVRIGEIRMLDNYEVSTELASSESIY